MFSLLSLQDNSKNNGREVEPVEPSPSKINRAGIPMLTSFEAAEAYDDYYSIQEGQYDYLDRAINRGTTLISDTEIDEYFKSFSDKGYRFAYKLADGTTRYYTINYFEVPISLESHNILVSIIDEQVDEVKKAEIPVLSEEEAGYISEALHEPYRWVQIGEEEAKALKKRIAEDGYILNVGTDEGIKTIRLMYIGPYSEELRLPEFQSMYGQIGKELGG
ncbi:MAG: SPOR domain-containing protein [Candidatus Nitrosocaldus sp.]|nr:SPOR domain-containing protein [Candidatus Nitrosocaldus sp.]MDW8276305.1 SPOR domain-containing protein [Candidatus Nitrosocaldus sp.]